MSKHKNYTNYSKPVEAPVVEEAVTEEVAVEETVEEVVEEAVEEPVVEEKITMGVVVNCERLKVREAGSTDADVITTIPALSEVFIEEEGSTNDFYKVCTEAGVEGYCMKKFIAIKQ